MSKILGINAEDETVNTESEDNVDTTTDITTDEDTTTETTETKTTDSDEGVLDRFKGKSKQDISKSYEDLEKLHGRQAQELGELRKLAREWLELETTKTSKQKKELTDEDFVENPRKAIEDLLDQRLAPVLKNLEGVDKQLKLSDFESRHPDYRDVATSQDFHEYVNSSAYRKRLYEKADAMDFDAADELFSMFKEQKKAIEEKAAKREVEKEKELRKVTSEKGSTSAPSKKKLYKSADLIRMRMRDPEKYWNPAFQAEIMEAYKDGRVK